MGFVHGRHTYVSLDGKNLSTYTNNTTYNRSADSHDVTTYGKAAHDYEGGQLDGTITIAGIDDNTAVTGPRPVISPLLGTKVDFVFRPEGTGSGRPEDTVDVVVTAYNESSAVADMVQWTAELQMSSAPVSAPQA